MPPYVAGEQPLRVFVSSVMNAVLRGSRSALFERLQASEMAPWMFEFTPASEEDSKTSYLAKVGECDVFVWVTSGTTTSPVEDEVRSALRAGKPILAFRLPDPGVDAATGALVEAVRERHKTQDVADETELATAVRDALRDFVRRRVRGAVTATAEERLSELLRRSIARCAARFVAAGVDPDVASRLAADRKVGTQPVLADRAVTVVCDQLGAGKSLAADREHQRAVEAARPGGPVPVWLAARDVQAGIEQAVRARSEVIGDPVRRGAHVVVDGVDESDLDPWGLLDEARELAGAWPSMTVIITSRPTVGLADAPERVAFPPLADDEVLALARLAGDAPAALYGFPTALRDAVRRPLFALLLGGARAAGEAVHAPHELVALLVQRALARTASAVRVAAALTALAVLTTERNGPVPVAEVADSAELETTGLVVREGGALRFGLAVVEQWFAAQAIGVTVSTADVAGDLVRLARWRYPIAIAVATGSHERIDALLSPVADRTPAVLAWIVDEAIASGLSDTVASLPPTMQAGEQLLQATSTFVRALGDLAPYATAADAGELPPLGIAAHANRVTTSWWEGPDGPAAPVVDLAATGDAPGWRRQRDGWNSGRSGWAWRYALDDVRADLKLAVDGHALPVPPVLQAEADWSLALQIGKETDRAPDEPISTARCLAFARRVRDVIKNGEFLQLSTVGPVMRIDDLVEITERWAQRDEWIAPPWPSRDEPPGTFVWSGYSTKRRRERVHAVFAAALDAYEWWAASMLRPISPLLFTHAVQPAIARVKIVHLDDVPIGGHENTIAWYLDPEPIRSESTAEVILMGEEELNAWWGNDTPWRVYQQIRPGAAAFTGFRRHRGIGRVFFSATPAADLAYSFLRSDLQTLRWIR